MRLTRREALKWLGAAGAAPLAGCGWMPWRETGPTWSGYDDATVIDGTGWLGPVPMRDPMPEHRLSDETLAIRAESGLTALNMTMGKVGNDPDMYEACRDAVLHWRRLIEASPGHLMLVRNATDLIEAKVTGRTGIIAGFQDGTMLGDDVARVDEFHGLGVRIIQPTYNGANALGNGCLVPDDGGLTELGREMVARMDEQRILVDLSHCGRRTAADALALVKRPASYTHTGCAALADRPRNRTDAELRAMAERGGVIGIYLMPFLRVDGQAMAEDVIRHVEHAIDVAGEDHVGIGTDGTVEPVALTEEYRAQIRAEIARRREAGISAPGETDDIVPLIPDLNSPRRMEHIAAMLSDRGHSDDRIAKVLGGNFARLFREVWG